jgi:hypothetical protein
MSGEKRLRVGAFDYVIDESARDIETIVGDIRTAMTDGAVVEVPVLDENARRMTLFLRGGQIDALVLDLDEGVRPGEISP